MGLSMEAPEVRIRPLDLDCDEEVALVARRMGETLDEVLGAEREGDRYRLEWLVDRVLQHLDPARLKGAVFVAEADGAIVGHTIVRLDADERGEPIGLFSTTFVELDWRRQGIAKALLDRGEQWMLGQGMARAVTYTDVANRKLHRLYLERGYHMRPMPRSFVALEKRLDGSSE